MEKKIFVLRTGLLSTLFSKDNLHDFAYLRTRYEKIFKGKDDTFYYYSFFTSRSVHKRILLPLLLIRGFGTPSSLNVVPTAK